MLDFLVTSKVRRRLLETLWRQGAVGSTAQLAAAAGVGFASAYRELRAMKAEGLAVTERRSGAQVYSANHGHPQADALRTLVAAPVSRPTSDPDEARRLRSQL